MNLQLSLKNKWFILTNESIKKEDYRRITPYWCNRLVLVNGKTKSLKWWSIIFCQNKINEPLCKINDEIILGNFSFKPFTQNTMTLGYPKSGDKDRIIKYEHLGIEIRTGNPEFGAEPNKLYFVIKHGKRILQ